MPEATLAAVIQMRSGDDRTENLAVAGELLEQAARAGARLAILPENFSFMGKTEAAKRHHAEDPSNGPSLTFLRKIAKDLKLWIVGGSVPLMTDAAHPHAKVSNTCFVLDDQGALQTRYDKIHLFDVSLGDGPPFRESEVIHPGNKAIIVNTPFGVLGLSICYDLRFPELYRKLAQQGATIFAAPAAFTLTTGKDHWELLLRARAVENFAYVLAANQWGRHPGGRRTYGHSMIVEPWGVVCARCPDGAGIALAPLEPQRVAHCRRKIPSLQHRVF